LSSICAEIAEVVNATPAGKRRLEAIDQFRGFAIFLMVLANYLSGIETVPAWLKHAPDVGYTIIDLIAPLFVFAMGLTYGLSFRRRIKRDGTKRTYEHFLARNLALIGLGFLLTLGGQLSGLYLSSVNWGLLQALGAAGLVTLLVIRLPWFWRAVVGAGLLMLYQILLDRFWLADVLAAPHNGPWGALSWGALLILSTVLADLYHGHSSGEGGRQNTRRWFAASGFITLCLGLLLALYVAISKNRASASYVLVSLGLSALTFYGFHLLDTHNSWQIPTLSAWGRNALLLYLLHGVVIGFFAIPASPGWYVQASAWLISVQAILLLGILSVIGLYLDNRGWYWSL
jgi:predicted acyltransferase